MQTLVSPAASSDRERNAKRAYRWVGGALLAYVVLWLQFRGVNRTIPYYLPLHSAMETMAIVVAMLGFGIAWNAYAKERPGNIIFIGVVLFGAGLLDFAHILSYDGMPDFVTASSTQKSISFWLAARYLIAVGLIGVALQPWRPLKHEGGRYRLLAAVLVFVALVYWAVLSQPDRLPAFFIAGQGLTSLKIGLEYLLVGLYGLAAWLFFRQLRKAVDFNAADLFVAAAMAVIAELCLTGYSTSTDLFNAAGHCFKIIGYGFIYRVVFVDSVRQPFAALTVALNHEKVWAAEQHNFVRTLDLLEEAVLELDLKGRITSANNGWWMLVGTAPATEASLLDHLHEEDRGAFELNLSSLLSGQKNEFRGRFRFHTGIRDEQWLECRFVAERGAEGGIVGVRGVLRDITKSYLQERHITHMALHDALTGLPNRVLLEDRIRQAIQQAGRANHHVGVCFIDLDHFKNINDAYGHKTGDAFLLALARLLKNCLREGDTLARWGGDEFVVLLPDLTDIDATRHVAQKMQDSMRQTIMLDDLAINATFSMGISVYPDDGCGGNIERLLSQADRAMFYAKAQGRNNIQLYADMSSKGLGKKELYIQARLAKAIREGTITVWFQPQVAAQPDFEGRLRLVGVEALARWQDPELGWIAPGSFIPMAENLGLISELCNLVRRQSFHQFRSWRQAYPELTLAVNISKRQLFAADFMDMLMADVEHYGLTPSMVVLEVTESIALMDVEFAEERLRQLAATGFTLALDDFGTGYASLSQLHELPIGELKIDISFVRRVNTDEGLRLTQGIVSMARALRLRTVAEGVENEATAQVLRGLGVDVLQGYHFGRPCPGEEFVKLPLFTAGVAEPQNIPS